VPQQLSVVGFDDLPISRWFSPPLTTVRQPLDEMAALAVRVLLDAEDGNSPVTRYELATDLIVRESTAPPQGA
jgi:DNA-binding LacI/PurR family transcriptional regulator